ncbi:MAG: type II toxin-antitoxin system HicB family antitoxin [Spirochaetaceae bacterium]|nr:type II toxin-antitoxin system HicB family antitoxin [Spirochaetaceae bacterium]
MERCPDTGFFVGYVPGFPGAHTQGETIEELSDDPKEVISMLLDHGDHAIPVRLNCPAEVEGGVAYDEDD